MCVQQGEHSTRQTLNFKVGDFFLTLGQCVTLRHVEMGLCLKNTCRCYPLKIFWAKPMQHLSQNKFEYPESYQDDYECWWMHRPQNMGRCFHLDVILPFRSQGRTLTPCHCWHCIRKGFTKVAFFLWQISDWAPILYAIL